jgi:hypothetical protein
MFELLWKFNKLYAFQLVNILDNARKFVTSDFFVYQKMAIGNLGDERQKETKIAIPASQSVPYHNIANVNDANGRRLSANDMQPLPENQTSVGSKKSSSSNLVGVHYKLGRKIGEGSFGIIYEGVYGSNIRRKCSKQSPSGH